MTSTLYIWLLQSDPLSGSTFVFLIWGNMFQDFTAADFLWVRLIHLSVYVCWIRMAQNRLVNYRHLLSKCGVCCQVLQHEVGLVRRGEKVEPGVKLHGRMLCHVLLDCLSSPCPRSENGSVVGILAHTHFVEMKCHLLNTPAHRNYAGIIHLFPTAAIWCFNGLSPHNQTAGALLWFWPFFDSCVKVSSNYMVKLSKPCLYNQMILYENE